MINWRKFQFFDKAIVNDEKSVEFFKHHDITCCTSGRGQLMFGDKNGTVHVMDRSLNIRKCLAHEQRVNHIQHVASKNFLVTIGEDGGEAFRDSLKIFNLNQYDVKSSSFIMVRNEAIFPKVQKNMVGLGKALHLIGSGGGGYGTGSGGSGGMGIGGMSIGGIGMGGMGMGGGNIDLQPSPVTCLQANRNCTAIALGLGDGHIILYVNENMDRPNTKMVRRVLDGTGGDHGRITGLKWGRYISPQQQQQQQQMMMMGADGTGNMSNGNTNTNNNNNNGSMTNHSNSGGAATNVSGGTSGANMTGTAASVASSMFNNGPITVNSGGIGGSGGGGGANESDEWEILYVTTVDRVFCYRVGRRGQVERMNELDDTGGCESGCATMSSDGDLVTATKTGVWFYKPEGKGSCFAFEGKKVMIDWFRNYLVVVSCDQNRSNQIHQTINIYDLKNKFIAFKYSSETLQVSHILQEWGSLFILASEKISDEKSQPIMYLLEEKDTQTKLEMLFQKNLYTIAISLVNSQQLDYNYVVEIFRKYGDHLYQKKDYDGAMTQYLRTIGKLEPSYIIREFLDAQRITNLTTYLEALHEKNLATSDHTTLLLNCYTKLKDAKKDKLDKFIQQHSNLHYDVETAIKVCRSSGYKEHALLLAKEHGEHDWFLKITIEDFPEDQFGANYRRALRHIESLPFNDAEKYMAEYGKILVTKLPKHSTNVLIRLCTDYFPVAQYVKNRTIYSTVSQTRSELLKAEKKSNESLQSTSTTHKLSGLDFLRFRGTASNTSNDTQSSSDSSAAVIDDKPSDRSNADNFIHAFSSQPYWLMLFLENVILRNAGSVQQPISTTVYNTVIELYLQYLDKDVKEHELLNNVDPMTHANASDLTTEAKDELEYTYDILPPNEHFARLSYKERCLELLEDPNSKFNTEHILVLVQSQNFREGVLKMYAKLGLHYDIIQYYMDQQDYENVINSCTSYGQMDPNLWIQALSYFVNLNSEAADTETNVNEYLSRVLQKIEKENLLPPLLVAQILSKSGSTIQLHTIQEYLCTRIAQEQMLMKEDEEQIKEYQSATKAMKNEVFNLKTSAKIFQLTTCSYCGQQLDLPAIHFMCGHSYHHRCCSSSIGEDEQESCPQCHKKNLEILQRAQRLDQSRENYDKFMKQLTSDGFSVVSEYLGRNMFSSMKVEDLDDLISEGDLYSDDDEDEDYDEDDSYEDE